MTIVDLLNQIRYLTDKNGQPQAVQIDIAVWKEILNHLQNSEQITADEAFGLWGDRTDIDDTWLENGRQQWQSRWKNEPSKSS